MKYKTLTTLILGLCLGQGALFAQSSTTNANGSTTNGQNTNGSSSSTSGQKDATGDGAPVAHEGVVFNLPGGSWWPISAEFSLAPNVMNKLQEQLETSKKVTVVFSSANKASTVVDLLQGAYIDLIPKWNDIQVVEQAHIISDPLAVGAPMKFSEIYQATDMKTGIVFRIEVVVATEWAQKGNRGILYIFTPISRYYENRFLIKDIRDALNMQYSSNKELPQNADNSGQPSKGNSADK